MREKREQGWGKGTGLKGKRTNSRGRQRRRNLSSSCEPSEAARGWGQGVGQRSAHRGVLKGRAREKGQAMHWVGHHRSRSRRGHLGRVWSSRVAAGTSGVLKGPSSSLVTPNIPSAHGRGAGPEAQACRVCACAARGTRRSRGSVAAASWPRPSPLGPRRRESGWEGREEAVVMTRWFSP